MAFTPQFRQQIDEQLQQIRTSGLEKRERTIITPQAAHIAVADGREVINFCANNYLGLANHPRIVSAAKSALDEHGFGMASVRFICGTQQVHLQLERAIAELSRTEATILYSSCFDANGGLFETILGEEDAVISDELNHASIIDGIRLCKARRFRYHNNNPDDLKLKLDEARASGARHVLIVTDGVFSMDGTIANLPAICDLADEYGAMLVVDDSHAIGFIGPDGAGTPALHNAVDRVDLVTGTLGKALGGASGGYITGRKPLIDLLRQRSRPYLFSNTLAPSIATASLEAIKLVRESDDLRDKLHSNTRLFRSLMTDAGFDILPGTHPITPVMFYDAPVAARVAERMLEQGVYVVAFSFPVVPMGKARIRCQVSAGHSEDDLRFTVEAFKRSRD
ncbi:MAG TPA: glycine C-acetyltransferase [Tepidisphaeraceae bacterium]|nr:glycine C-acetyltransferase [Tepidisphaeraceae bacterium]